MNDTRLDPLTLLRPRRAIQGISAILLPFLDDGSVDWVGFDAHVLRTADAGLTPAVNMDTGYGNLLSDAEKRAVLDRTRGVLGNRPFVSGALVLDQPGSRFDLDGYVRAAEDITNRGGTPVIVQSFGLTQQPGEKIVAAYQSLGDRVGSFIGFELGTMFAPFGAIYSLEVYRGLMGVRQCLGAKHSSLRRDLEWQRLMLRDQVRPEFKVYTGNDLAIDMVMYGSDYLLGLSTIAPDWFAKRDHYWQTGDPRFYELNDQLQYLGFFAFRDPVPAYKHSAAQFLKLRGWLQTSRTHPRSPTRPESDVDVLKGILTTLS